MTVALHQSGEPTTVKDGEQDRRVGENDIEVEVDVEDEVVEVVAVVVAVTGGGVWVTPPSSAPAGEARFIVRRKAGKVMAMSSTAPSLVPLDRSMTEHANPFFLISRAHLESELRLLVGIRDCKRLWSVLHDASRT